MPCCLFKLKHFFREIKSPSSGTLLKGVRILFSLIMASKTSFLDRPKLHFSNFSLFFKGQNSWLTHFMALYPSQSIDIFTYCSFRYPIRPSSCIYYHLSAFHHINSHFSVFLLIRSENVCLCMHHVCNKHYKAMRES